tara:strand:+ start:5132 stop:5461 length:330 start_codon:yes stop_codon:yes gene_type:complete
MKLLTLYLPCSALLHPALTWPMDSLFLFLLLLGGAPDSSSMEVPRGQASVQVMASATILRGETIDFGNSVNQSAMRTKKSGDKYQIALTRSTGEIENIDGRKIQLQEFH